MKKGGILKFENTMPEEMNMSRDMSLRAESHWKEGSKYGIMSPYVAGGKITA